MELIDQYGPTVGLLIAVILYFIQRGRTFNDLIQDQRTRLTVAEKSIADNLVKLNDLEARLDDSEREQLRLREELHHTSERYSILLAEKIKMETLLEEARHDRDVLFKDVTRLTDRLASVQVFALGRELVLQGALMSARSNGNTLAVSS